MAQYQNHKPYYRACSECGADISDRPKNSFTCSQKCRTQRSLRTRRQKHNHSEGASLLNKLVNDRDITQMVVERELAPVVREALTEDVMHAIHGIVGLLPIAQAAMLEDLASPDKILRQKAYTLLMRYTVGHGALVPQADPTPPGLVVNFGGMPRPEGVQPSVVMGPAPAEPTDVVEMLVCNACDETKPANEFVGKSDRCQECHDRLQGRARELEKTIKEYAA